MSRPQKERLVDNPPKYSEFKPAGVAAKFLDQIELTLDEYEALRLADYEAMSQEDAAATMQISRPTFTRLIAAARFKISDFLINGKILNIDGGNIHFRENLFRCLDCGHIIKSNFNHTFERCPVCLSPNLLNMAGSFGHGKCCANRHRGKGGKHAGRR